jgi:hypothetical protein
MRILPLAFAAVFALSFVTVQAEPAQAVGLCTYNDTTNNMGGPGSECEGVFCMGYSNGDWQTCVPPHPCDVYSCPPPPIDPIVTESSMQAAAICVVADVYNTGSLPCDGLVCYGQTQSAWQTCVGESPCIPPRCHIPPPQLAGSTASAGTSLCTAGDLYNNQAGQPSSGCDGVVCTGYANGDWDRCVLDCTADGCPRLFEDPCDRLMCQPPFDP